MVKDEGVDLGIEGLSCISCRLYVSFKQTKGTHYPHIAELFQGRIHAFLHDEKFLLLLLDHTRDLALFLVDLP